MKFSIVATLSSIVWVAACGNPSEQDGPAGPIRTTGTTGSGATGATSTGPTGAGGAATGASGTGADGTGGASSGSGGSAGASGGSGGSGTDATTGAGGATGGAGGRGAGGGGGSGSKDAGAAGSTGTGGARPDGGAPSGIAARDVQLTIVEANQSTAVALLKSGALVPPAMRNATLIEGRPTLVRAHFDVGATWMARSILGVLTLTYQDGTKQLVTQSKNVTADSNPDQLASTFNFLLTAAEVKPGMSINVELQETAQPSTPEPAQPPRFPADGTPANLGIKAGAMDLKVVIIPAQTSGGFPLSTDERRQKLYNHLFDIYPVQTVTIDWRDPMPLADEKSSSAAFTLLRDTCNADKAKANVIYHMILRNADGGFSFSGTSSGSNSSPTSGCRAVSLTVVNGATAYIDGNVDTVAHELGHNHGSRHIACGGAAGPDPAFPYMDGFLGAQGYSISENALKPTSMFKELMGYCRPRWISDWMWNKFEAKVRTFTSWPVPLESAPSGRSLTGYVESNGKAHWAVVPGQLTEPNERVSPSRHAKVWSTGAVRTLPVSVIPFSEPGLVEVVATLPDGPLPARAAVVVEGVEHVIDFGAIPKF